MPREHDICARLGGEWVSLGKGATYANAIQAVRRRAHILQPLIQPATLIRVYERPAHQWGAIVPKEALQ